MDCKGAISFLSYRLSKRNENSHRVRRPDTTQGSGRSPDLPFLEKIVDEITVGMISLGCPKNSIDSEIMLGLLEKEGFKLTSNKEEAQIIIINTCSFIESAKNESIEAILEIAELKKKNSLLKSIIVTGCLPQRYKDKLSKEIPEIDFILGLDHVSEIAKICKKIIADKRKPSRVHQLRKWTLSKESGLYKSTTPRKLLTPKATAYVKITDGCNNWCSYCTIPSIRGRFRSRSIISIIDEVNLLAENGVKEINLIGQDTTSYGKDFKKNINFIDLLKKLTGVKGIKWIRILYTYPSEINQELINLICNEEKICKYLDVPVQHIDDSILKNMRRRYTGKDIYSLIDKIRKSIPNISLRTSVITGFPGETDKKFKKLCSFIKEIEFENLGAFSYSREEGTKAYALKNQVPEKVKIKRLKEIMKIQKKITFNKNKELIGSSQKVLIEGYSEETDLLLEGRTQGQAPDVDGITYINEGNPSHGEISSVLITDAIGYDLVGKVV